MNDEVSDVNGQYMQATSEAEAVRLRAAVGALVGEARGARRRQYAALGAAAAVYGASIVDAFVRHAFRPGLRAAVEPVQLGAGGSGLRLALTF